MDAKEDEFLQLIRNPILDMIKCSIQNVFIFYERRTENYRPYNLWERERD